MRLIHVQPPISFVPIRVHSWFRTPPPFRSLSCLSWTNPTHHSPLRFIRENPCSSVARKTPLIRLIRGLEPRLPRGPSPLTPGPSPLPGARGAMWRCRGDLVLKPEQHWHATYPCPAADLIRAHSCSFMVQTPPPFVSIRVYSWFKTRPPFRALSCLSWTNPTHHQPPAFHP
jgi:hypothetical protein